MDTRPIGIFDSGVGGLTVINKVLRLLPNENIIYFGDTARVPYGNKSKETIIRFSKEIVKYLLGVKVKLIVVACNTASSLSLETLKRSFSVPVVGVIKPGVEEALKVSRNKRIGVIGTEATISSNTYKKAIENIDKSFFVIQKSCPLFVPLVETMHLYDDIAVRVAENYLSPIFNKGIDTLILGCTHYPLLKNVIQRIAGRDIELIDSSMAVARHVKRLMERRNLIGGSIRPYTKFFASDNTENFSKLAKIFLRKSITAR